MCVFMSPECTWKAQHQVHDSPLFMYIERRFRARRHRGPLESHAHENPGLRARTYSRLRGGITLDALAEPTGRELCLDGVLSVPGDTGSTAVGQVPSTVQITTGISHGALESNEYRNRTR